MKATIGIKVECFDSNFQTVANFEISLYLTDLTDTPQKFGRMLKRWVCFIHTHILIPMIRFWKTCSWNMHVKGASCHCIIIQIYPYRNPCDVMNSAFSSINNPKRGLGEKKQASKNCYINSQNCLDLERQMLTEGKEWVSPVLVLPTSGYFWMYF